LILLFLLKMSLNDVNMRSMHLEHQNQDCVIAKSRGVRWPKRKQMGVASFSSFDARNNHHRRRRFKISFLRFPVPRSLHLSLLLANPIQQPQTRTTRKASCLPGMASDPVSLNLMVSRPSSVGMVFVFRKIRRAKRGASY
jgi:hypothetical protein